MRKKLQVADLGNFLDQPLLAMVASSISNGEIGLTPYWYEWRDGGFNLFTLANGIKHHQLLHSSLVSIAVAENSGINRGIEVRGRVHFSNDDVNTICLRIAQRYLPSERVALFMQELEKFPMIHVRIEPGKLRAWDTSDGVPGWRTEVANASQREAKKV